MNIQELIDKLETIPAEYRTANVVFCADDGDGTLYEIGGIENNVVHLPLSEGNPLTIMSGEETAYPTLFDTVTGEQL